MNSNNKIVKKRYSQLLVILFFSSLLGCSGKNTNQDTTFDEKKILEYCVKQVRKTLNTLDTSDSLPRSIESKGKEWHLVPANDWTSGFWPGILWYLYEYTGDEYFKIKADSFTSNLKSLAYIPAASHDLGFMMYCSYGNQIRLTGCKECKEILQNAAYRLSDLYNPTVGTILSWPEMIEKMNWPYNTIIDNMMNLELLYWAGKTSGDSTLINIANRHAKKTMENQFRKDYSVYHVIVYDTLSGKKIKGVTHQGYSDETMWARGQAWAIYGFTMAYRESRNPEFLDFVQKVTDVYLAQLPDDYIPYWDFNAPNIPDEPKDASAAAITASALLELSGLVENKDKSIHYYIEAICMLKSLSTNKYLSKDQNPSFLMHSVGHKPNNSEIDVSLIYADYYYLEALIKLSRIKDHNSILPD